MSDNWDFYISPIQDYIAHLKPTISWENQLMHWYASFYRI